MKKSIIFISMFFLCNFIYISKADSSIINATSCSRTHVVAAISSAINGDTVIVPSCPGGVSWSSDIVVNKEITIKGNTTGCPDSCDDNTLILGNCFSIQANNVRITGFTFLGSGEGFNIGNIHNYRIDHNEIAGYRKAAIFSKGSNYGLWDHNYVKDCSGECLYVYGDGNNVWAEDSGAGGYTDGTIYFEDNIFITSIPNSKNIIDSGQGAKYVFRYNTVTDTSTGYYGKVLEAHGHYWPWRDGPNNAGAYSQEVYGNTFNSSSFRSWGIGLQSRGGRVLFFDNTFTGDYWNNAGSLSFWNVEAQVGNSGCSGNCPAAVAAHAAMGIHPDPWFHSSQTYPTPLQANNSYIWGNPLNFTVSVESGAETLIIEDRDFWDDIGAGDTNFNTGTSRPATCAVDDVYYETDNKKLYRCVAPDVWTLVYEPYPYPHPLTVSTGTPRNLRVEE